MLHGKPWFVPLLLTIPGLLMSARAAEGQVVADCDHSPCTLLGCVPPIPLPALGSGAKDEAREVEFSGQVLDPFGMPVSGAAIVTTAGGRAVSDGEGLFRLTAALAICSQTVRVTAATGSGAATLVGSMETSVPSWLSSVHVGVLAMQGLSNAGCPLSWLPTFGAAPGTSNVPFGFAVYDDGEGPAMYVGGAFTAVVGLPADYIAKWDGSNWTEVGGGTNNSVRALAVFDDGKGSGPALYAGGDFGFAGGVSAVGIAKWDGDNWAPVGGGAGGAVHALAVYDDGSGGGPDLYAGGNFTNYIAKWDGTSWSTPGGGMNGLVYTLAAIKQRPGVPPVRYGSAGPYGLYAGGQFTTAGGILVNYVAKWDGSSWSGLGSGMNNVVLALRAAAIGGEDIALYAGGQFTNAGSYLAKWDGSIWSALGSGTNAPVRALHAFDDGSGSGLELYAGGDFTAAGGMPASHIAKWDGSSWSHLPGDIAEQFGGSTDVRSLGVYDDGRGVGTTLWVGGSFTTVGGLPADRLAVWDGASWSAFGTGANRSVEALCVYDDKQGGGPALYIGGEFKGAGGAPMGHIAKWDGVNWLPVAGGTNATVRALAVYDDPGPAGPELYVGGDFARVGPNNLIATHIAKWNGSSWSPLGGGVSASVLALAVHTETGNQPALYAGGAFTIAGAQPAHHIAKWNGSNWSSLGSGTEGTNGWVYALIEYDEGTATGLDLYAGGDFTTAGGVSALGIARWDGSSWSSVGGPAGAGGSVRDFAVYDEGHGNGPELFAGGFMDSCLKRWNGSSWSVAGGGVNNFVYALTVHDDGCGGGPALYVGGAFTVAGGTGGVAANRIARWDGMNWSPLGNGMHTNVLVLAPHDDGQGGGPALFAGGQFYSDLDSGDSYLAKWGR